MGKTGKGKRSRQMRKVETERIKSERRPIRESNEGDQEEGEIKRFCPFFTLGFCRYGAKCLDIHENNLKPKNKAVSTKNLNLSLTEISPKRDSMNLRKTSDNSPIKRQSIISPNIERKISDSNIPSPSVVRLLDDISDYDSFEAIANSIFKFTDIVDHDLIKRKLDQLDNHLSEIKEESTKDLFEQYPCQLTSSLSKSFDSLKAIQAENVLECERIANLLKNIERNLAQDQYKALFDRLEKCEQMKKAVYIFL